MKQNVVRQYGGCALLEEGYKNVRILMINREACLTEAQRIILKIKTWPTMAAAKRDISAAIRLTLTDREAQRRAWAIGEDRAQAWRDLEAEAEQVEENLLRESESRMRQYGIEH